MEVYTSDMSEMSYQIKQLLGKAAGATNSTLRSSFISCLKSDRLVPSVSLARELVEEDDDEQAIKLKMHTPRIVSQGAHYAFTVPEKRLHYKTLFKSPGAFSELKLDITDDHETNKVLNAEQLVTTDKIFPYSMAYAGFQFGSFAGQLGDGRVVNLFDINDYTVQVKGCGLTPFSRFADGKAVLRSSIREFVISESLHAIGIPSTRALQLTLLPGTRAKREGGYEPAAQVTRFAPSWVRIGNFDLQRWRQDIGGLIKLTDYCIEEVIPKAGNINLLSLSSFKRNPIIPQTTGTTTTTTTTPDEPVKQNSAENEDSEFDYSVLTKYDEFIRKVVILNAKSVGYWQAYGFLNGVLNTDNTSILGLSIDFGPFSFIDKFDPLYTSNHDDVNLRYSLQQQPSVIWWNLQKLSESLSILIGSGPKYIDSLKETSSINDEMADYMTKRAKDMMSYIGHEYMFWCAYYVSKISTERVGLNILESPDEINDNNVRAIGAKIQDINENLLEPLWSFLYQTKIDYNTFFINFQKINDYSNFKKLTGTDSVYKKDFIETLFANETIGQNQSLVEYLTGQNIGNHPELSAESKEEFESIKDALDTWTNAYTRLYQKYNVDQEGNPDLKLKHEISRKVNPLFIPRSFMFEEVIEDYMDRQRDSLHDHNAEIDNSLLEKLFLMSTNPYDKTKWKKELHPEVAAKWISNLSKPENTMKQCGCSS